jgi:ABC-2 type transport system ATP-binding protein
MYDYMPVGEIIDFSRALYPRWNAGTVNKYLDIFELPKSKRVKQLSKGMRTQLALVLALGPEPDLLIMDEPTSGLDPIKRKEFLTTVLAEVSLSGQTVFMSSHQLAEVERLADWIGIIDRGRLQIACPADELKGQLKKVRVAFNTDPAPQLLTRPGILRVEREGRNYLLTFRGDQDDLIEHLRQADYRSLEVLDLTLEDIFTELAGRDSTPARQGPGRSQLYRAGGEG